MSTSRQIQTLAQLIAELQSRVPHHQFVNPAVSKGSVGWHIEHTLLTLNLVLDVIKKSDPAHYKARFDWRRLVVLLLGKIPRGRIKAPKMVQPTVQFNADTLQQHVLRAQQNLAGMQQVSAQQFFTHPFLGDFKLKPALRFLQVHTQHHLNIINDILKKKQEPV